MRISELIDKAGRIQAKYGDLDVEFNDGHGWKPTDICLYEKSSGRIIATFDYGAGLVFTGDLMDTDYDC